MGNGQKVFSVCHFMNISLIGTVEVSLERYLYVLYDPEEKIWIYCRACPWGWQKGVKKSTLVRPPGAEGGCDEHSEHFNGKPIPGAIGPHIIFTLGLLPPRPGRCQFGKNGHFGRDDLAPGSPGQWPLERGYWRYTHLWRTHWPTPSFNFKSLCIKFADWQTSQNGAFTSHQFLIH